ncbi:hypothetical protein PS900_03090 [Pseudomonas fluorescens]|uniref:Uncharacterized protein n=1 Tax=Pseudomonas fluorescens TaxID=294 RepID=A0A8H2RT46_PSEFL|nr:hypothetical protein PS900_03090 [Pseudomonas fluorescens]
MKGLGLFFVLEGGQAMSGGEKGRQVAVWRYRHSCAARSKLDGLKVEASNWRS